MIARRNTRSTPGDGLGMFAPSPVAQILNSESMDTSGWVDPSGGPAPDPPPPGLPAVAIQNVQRIGADAEAFFKNYSGRSLASPDAPVYSKAPPWVQPPDGFISFAPLSSIATPNNNGVDTDILSFVVPSGYDGIIKRIANYFTGPGLISNIGQLVWRLKLNGNAVRNFDAISLFYGSFTANAGLIPMEFDGLQIRAGDRVQFAVNHLVTSPLPFPNTFVIGFLGGYLYPKETS